MIQILKGYKLFKLFLFIFGVAFCQHIPSYRFFSGFQNLLYDEGVNWKKLSVFEPMNFLNSQSDSKNSLYSFKPFHNSLGIYHSKNSTALSGFFSILGQNNFFIYIQPNITYSEDLTNLKINYSGIGFKNKWACLQISKNNESWGAGNNIELGLSKNSSLFNYFSLSSDYGQIRVRYIHGFLERTNENINRYITGKAIEWTNKKSIIIGFSETVIYSGYKRSFDIAYLNPISTHLEIELNERLNIPGSNNSNAVWQIHSDFFVYQKMRISANFLLDELVFDPKKQIGKENGYAYSFKTVYPLLENLSSSLTVSIAHAKVGTPTFRHGNGFNNFVQGDMPLGHRLGSDFHETKIGLTFSNKRTFIFSLSSSLSSIGQESIIFRPFEAYKDYQKSMFPSGEIISLVNNNVSAKYILFKKILSEIRVDRKKIHENTTYDFIFIINFLFD